MVQGLRENLENKQIARGNLAKENRAMLVFAGMRKYLTLIVVFLTLTSFAGCKSSVTGGANSVATDGNSEADTTETESVHQPPGTEFWDPADEEDIYSLPLDERSRKILEKFANERPDEIFNGGINFSEWVHVDTLYPILKELDPPVVVTGVCFRPAGIPLGSCFPIYGKIGTSDPYFSDSLQKAYFEEAKSYKMSMEDSEFYFEEAYPKLQGGDVEFYALLIEATPSTLLWLWDEFPSVRFISPGKGVLFQPIIVPPETPLELVR